VCSCAEEYEALVGLSFLQDDDGHVPLTEHLQLNIDISEDLSRCEVERLIQTLHTQIRFIQSNNSNARMLLAEDMTELTRAYETPDLGKFDWVAYRDLNKADVADIASIADAKKAILGLAAWHRHFVRQDTCDSSGEPKWVYSGRKKSQVEMSSLDSALGEVSDSFRKIYGRGYGISTVQKGYDIASKAIHKQLVEQRRGRYQNRKMSTQRKAALEEMPAFPLSRLHANDVDVVVNRVENLKMQGFDAVLKQHSDGSLWVVTYEK